MKKIQCESRDAWGRCSRPWGHSGVHFFDRPTMWMFKWPWIGQVANYQRGDTYYSPCDDPMCERLNHSQCPHGIKKLGPMANIPKGWEMCQLGCGFIHRIEAVNPMHSHEWLNGEYQGMSRIIARMMILGWRIAALGEQIQRLVYPGKREE